MKPELLKTLGLDGKKICELCLNVKQFEKSKKNYSRSRKKNNTRDICDKCCLPNDNLYRMELPYNFTPGVTPKYSQSKPKVKRLCSDCFCKERSLQKVLN